MKSMTGYGRGECTKYNRKFIVEIKAVNHRYNDLTIKLPRAMLAYEDTIKKILSKEILRGKTDVFISFETASKEDVKINLNEALADAYVDALKEIKKKYSLDEDITLNMISKFPDVISVDKSIDTESEGDKILEALEDACNEALQNFIKMRETEGNSLKKDILIKLEEINEKVNQVNKRAPFVASEYRQRLLDKLKEYEEIKVEESRIVTEVTIFADKACIDEEITRLYSHIEQMKNILNETEPIGRKLDFLVQEMNREVNTIGSKSNDLEITNCTVELKSEIEKIREQIQNIE